MVKSFSRTPLHLSALFALNIIYSVKSHRLIADITERGPHWDLREKGKMIICFKGTREI